MNLAQTVTPPSTSDRRIRSFSAIPSPHEVLTEFPLGARRAERVARDRDEVADILAGRDDRLLVVVGPCSVHDPAAALEYASRLAKVADELGDRLKIVMRVYFEKPRTTVGWKGLINDPGMDGSFDVARGLRVARQLLLDIIDIGLPVGCEFLEPTSPQYIADAVAWGAIGARTTESQVHRQLASGLSMPVGFKNGTDGNTQVAVDGAKSAAASHVFFGMDDLGRCAGFSRCSWRQRAPFAPRSHGAVASKRQRPLAPDCDGVTERALKTLRPAAIPPACAAPDQWSPSPCTCRSRTVRR